MTGLIFWKVAERQNGGNISGGETNSCLWFTGGALWVTEVNNCKETWCEGVRAALVAEPVVTAAGCRVVSGGGSVGCLTHPVSHSLPQTVFNITWTRTKQKQWTGGAMRCFQTGLWCSTGKTIPYLPLVVDTRHVILSLCGESTSTAIWNPTELNKNLETFNRSLKSKKKKEKKSKWIQFEANVEKTNKNLIQSITTAEEWILKPSAAQRGYLVADNRGRAFRWVWTWSTFKSSSLLR